jgi:hypothetical protein
MNAGSGATRSPFQEGNPMKIKLLVSMAGPARSWEVGDEDDFPDNEAINLIQAGFAVPVEAKVEKAVKAPAAEKRVK